MATDGKKDPAKVLDRMRVLCSRREYCRGDIMKKLLTALEGDRDQAQLLMDQLISEKYIDDSRYASAYARDKSSIAGWGAVKIRYMLQAKGISQEDISSALADIDDDRASSKLYKLLETKARSLKNDPQKGLKLKRFALSRGYGYDEVSKMVDTILYNENDDSL